MTEHEVEWLRRKFMDYADVFAQEDSDAGTSFEEVEAIKDRANDIFDRILADLR